MVAKLKNVFRRNKKDNKGAALVMVIVAIAFIGMLVAMILYMSYCNYLMKGTDRQSKDNFYTAEKVLDAINAGLQRDISDSMSEAYVYTMQSSQGKSADSMTITFQDQFLDKVTEKIKDASFVNKWSIAHLKDMITADGYTLASTSGNLGAYIEATGGDNIISTSTDKTYLTMGNLHIVYTDDRGYVSIINTDIRLRVPEIDFAQSSTKMNVENFSLIANTGIINDGSNKDPLPSGISVVKGSHATVTGNVFGGYEGIQVNNQNSLSFVTDAEDLTAETLPDAVEHRYNLIADSINVSNELTSNNGLFVGERFSTYVSNINVTTGRIDLDGETYVSDDLDISGSNSEVKLSGIYRGYGNIAGKSEGSSSILVNGAGTQLDFSDLSELMLSGHAYVGAKRYDADLDRLKYATSSTDSKSDYIDDVDSYNKKLNASDSTYEAKDTTIPENKSDIVMGEAITVKANQLLYMVPGDCIGYESGTDNQVITKNPMTYEEYDKLLNDVVQKEDANGNKVEEKKYEPVRLTALWNRLGGVVYTNKYKAVYRRVNGTVLVYLYLDFGSNDTMANEFYKAYYTYDPTGINKYIKSYVKSLEWSDALTANNAEKLTLAGNAFSFDNKNEVVLQKDSNEDSDKYLNMMEMQETYGAVYNSLMYSLSPEYSKLLSSQNGVPIFESMVVGDFNKLSGIDYTDGTVSAVISDTNVLYPSTNCPAKTRVIVSAGDVYLKADYTGLVIAKGNIYLCEGCTKIDYDPVSVLQALKTSGSDGINTHYAYEIFGTNGELSYGIITDTGSNDTINLKDLITYQNWKKE